MKSFFTELFVHNSDCNQKILQRLTEHEEHISAKTINLYKHILDAHSIWNKRITPDYIFQEKYNLQNFVLWDIKNLNVSLSIIENRDMNTYIEYTTKNGNTYSHSIPDILYQIIQHSNYHRGQIAAEMRQCNIEPVLTDWIYYKMN